LISILYTLFIYLPSKRTNLLEPALATVGEQKIRNRVVAHEKVHPSIVIDVRRHHPPSFRGRSGDPGFLADVGECAVAVVVEQPARHRLVGSRLAVPPRVGWAVTAENVLGFVKVCEPADEYVQPPIVVA